MRPYFHRYHRSTRSRRWNETYVCTCYHHGKLNPSLIILDALDMITKHHFLLNSCKNYFLSLNLQVNVVNRWGFFCFNQYLWLSLSTHGIICSTSLFRFWIWSLTSSDFSAHDHSLKILPCFILCNFVVLKANIHEWQIIVLHRRFHATSFWQARLL